MAVGGRGVEDPIAVFPFLFPFLSVRLLTRPSHTRLSVDMIDIIDMNDTNEINEMNMVLRCHSSP